MRKLRSWQKVGIGFGLGLIMVGALSAALTTTTIHPFTLDEDTGVDNTELTLSVATSDLPRRLLSISTVCDASTTITVAANIDRTLPSGVVVILLPSVTITATTSGALYVDIPLLPTDVVDVTVPAAGAGILCSVAVITERR